MKWGHVPDLYSLGQLIWRYKPVILDVELWSHKFQEGHFLLLWLRKRYLRRDHHGHRGVSVCAFTEITGTDRSHCSVIFKGPGAAIKAVRKWSDGAITLWQGPWCLCPGPVCKEGDCVEAGHIPDTIKSCQHKEKAQMNPHPQNVETLEAHYPLALFFLSARRAPLEICIYQKIAYLL